MENKKLKHANLIFSLFALFVFFISFTMGRYPVDISTLIKVLLSKIIQVETTWNNEIEFIIFNLRLPRIILSFLIGSSLSLAGLAFQGIFQNPMVSPDILGTSSAAAFGAALSILLGLSTFMVTLVSFTFGLLAIFIVILISSRIKNMKNLSLVLAGIMVSSIFSSFINLVKTISDPEQKLPSITFFLMGSLSNASWNKIAVAAVIIIPSILLIFLLRWNLNVMALGDEEAHCLGVNVKLVKYLTLIIAALLSAISTSLCGLIGFIGLVVPHFVKLLLGQDFRSTIPATIILGGSFLLLTDSFSRSMFNVEIPLSIITSLIGAPFFFFLLLKEDKKC